VIVTLAFQGFLRKVLSLVALQWRLGLVDVSMKERKQTIGRVLQVVGAIWAVIGVLDIVEGLHNIGPGHPTLGVLALILNFVLFVIPGLGLFGLGALVVRRKNPALRRARKQKPESGARSALS
jgi:hypothetical protein